MTLSIIIVSWNTKELLRRCLDSLVSSIQYPVFSMEIIIVDNGSVDGSQEMVKRYIIQNTKYKIRLIENKENLGFAKAVNQALRQVYTEQSRSAQDEAVLLLNSDTIVKDETLEKLIEFEKKIRPAIIGARMLNVDGTVQGSCFYLPTAGRAIREYWFKKGDYFSKYAPKSKDSVEVEAVSGGAMMISKKVIEKIGFFDERYFMYFEDLDFCKRAGKAGFKIYYLPTAEIVHEHGASGRGLANESNQWKRLVPSSKIYHGILKHWLITLILKLGRK